MNKNPIFTLKSLHINFSVLKFPCKNKELIMKKVLACILVLSGLSVARAEAFDWGALFSLFSSSAGQQTTVVQTSQFSDLEQQMSAIDLSVQTAFVDIVSKLSGWWDTRSIKSQIKKQDKALADIITSYTNEYLVNKSDAVAKKIKNMSEKEKSALVKDITTLTDNGQKYLLLATNTAKTAASTLKTAQNIADVSNTVANINKMAVDLRSRATTVYNMAKQLKAIANAAGVTVK